jgi:hypothetical protein
MPAHFSVNAMLKNMTDLENLRQLLWTLQQFLQIVNNTFMVLMMLKVLPGKTVCTISL